MKSFYQRCGALDVHKETVVACARVQKAKDRSEPR